MNCKQKEKYIDGIIKLEEQTQGILMETVVKYIQKEEESPAVKEEEVIVQKPVEAEYAESLKTQLTAKDAERLSLLDHMRKVEQDNEELTKKLEEEKKNYDQILLNYEQVVKELDIAKSNSQIEDLAKAGQNERELEDEIEELKLRLDNTQNINNDSLKTYEEANRKLREDLTTSEDKNKEYEKDISLMKQQLELLEVNGKSEQSIMKEKRETIEMMTKKMEIIENEISDLEQRNKKLVEDNYLEKTLNKSLRENLTEAENEIARLREEQKKNQVVINILEKKMKQDEQESTPIRKSFDSKNDLNPNACELLTKTNMSLETQCSELTQKVEDLESKNKEYERTINQLNIQIDSLNQNKGNINDELKVLQGIKSIKSSGSEQTNEELKQHYKQKLKKLKVYYLFKKNVLGAT